MTPAERTLRARLAAHARWKRCEDPVAATSAARAGFFARFEDEVDPYRILDPAVRATRAHHALCEHMARLRLRRYQ
jgi:hypothetical protein